MWDTLKANLTWSAAAKFYIWLVGMAATYATGRTDLPEWVPVVLGAATLIAGWVKKQQPVASTVRAPS